MKSNTAWRAYSDARAPVRDARGSEYQVIAAITHRMHTLDPKNPVTYPRFIEVLHENRKLWDVISTDVAFDTNKLPVPVKAQLFYLAEFVRFHTNRVIHENESHQVLIDINASVMQGLRPIEPGAA